MQHCPMADFPFFGRRLGEVQEYVRGCHPTTFRELWNDKRDTLAWWTIWVGFLIFCSLFILLSFGAFDDCLFHFVIFPTQPPQKTPTLLKIHLTSPYRQ